MSHIINIRPFLTHRPEDLRFIEIFKEELLDVLLNIPRDELDYGFCHGDFHGLNAHKNNKGITFFDFDCCGFGWRAYDIAVFRWGPASRIKSQNVGMRLFKVTKPKGIFPILT